MKSDMPWFARVRIVAIKTAVRHLRPGDLFSNKDGSYWNRAMTGRVLPEALICPNDPGVADAGMPDEFVYRLTIIREGETKEENPHVISGEFNPYAPPGSK
jgi:hypothetical protein